MNSFIIHATPSTTTLPAVVMTGVLVLASVACGASNTSPDGAARQPVAVEIVAASPTEIADRLEAGGVVAAMTSAAISSRVVAPVLELRVRAGDRVRRGDVLVTLDGRDLAAQARESVAAVSAAEQALAASRAELRGASADQKLANASYARISMLHGRNSATAQELDEADARRASAIARVETAEARIEQALAQSAAMRAAAEAAATTSSFALVAAPFDGVVTDTFIDPGNLATPGTPLLRLESIGPARVEASIDEARVAYVRPGDRVEVLLDGDGHEGKPSATVDGVVTEVARGVDSDRRAFTVKVSLPSTAVARRSGSFARIRFRGASRPAVVIPVTAVRRQGQIATAFVVTDGTARLRLLHAAAAGEQGIEVLAGLDAGELVVANPPAALHDGDRVVPRAAAERGGGR